MNYDFSRRIITDGVDRKQFEADDILSALQQASNFWFHGEEVISYVKDQNKVITLLAPHGEGEGNVIGTLFDFT